MREVRDNGSTSVMPSQEKEWKALAALEALKKKTPFLKSAENFSYQLELFHEFLIFQLKTDAVFIFFFFSKVQVQ